MDESSFQSRLNAIEIRLKRLQRRAKFAAWGWSLTVAGFLISARLPYSEAATAKPDVLRVRQLIVVDDKGTERVVIGPIPDPLVKGKRWKRRSPATGVQVNDASGNERGGVAILDDGSFVVGIDDGVGQERAHLYFIPAKGAGLLLHGENEKETASITIPAGQPSAPKIEMTDRAGKTITEIPARR